MNTFKKAFAFVVAVLLIATMVVPAAAKTANEKVYAGETVTVCFTYNSSYSLDGEFTVTDAKGIIEGTPDYRIQQRDGMAGGQVSGNKCFLYDTSNPAVAHDVVVCAVLNIKSTAKVGDTCQISFAYNKGTDGTGMKVESGTDTATVEIVKRPEDQKPDEPTKPSTPSKPGQKIDRTELARQISIAEGLNEKDYTAETWQTLKDALKEAKNRMTTGNQTAVDAAAQQLAAAIAALKRVDHTALKNALESVKGLTEDQKLGDLLTQLVDAMCEGKELLNSNDQAAIDACAAKINDLVAQVKKLLEEMKKVENVVEKEPVEVEPQGPYCNIKIHSIWPIIAIVSLILNAAFIAVIVVYYTKKKKYQEDNTPLVNYDIADDE
jgi:hypothetical protein